MKKYGLYMYQLKTGQSFNQLMDNKKVEATLL